MKDHEFKEYMKETYPDEKGDPLGCIVFAILIVAFWIWVIVKVIQHGC